MIRRPPTRIELKLDDLQEYETMRRDPEKKDLGGNTPTWTNVRTKLDVVRVRIGYVPQPRAS